MFCLFDFGDIENGGLAGKPRSVFANQKKNQKRVDEAEGLVHNNKTTAIESTLLTTSYQPCIHQPVFQPHQYLIITLFHPLLQALLAIYGP